MDKDLKAIKRLLLACPSGVYRLSDSNQQTTVTFNMSGQELKNAFSQLLAFTDWYANTQGEYLPHNIEASLNSISDTLGKIAEYIVADAEATTAFAQQVGRIANILERQEKLRGEF